jgi:F-type H+-transporting ATPase subunit epsilon
MKVHVASVEGVLYRGEARSIVTETTNGELKILPGHAPLLGVLRPGLLRVYRPVSERHPPGYQDLMLISGGYLEVQPDSVTVLVDSFERAEDIDAEQAAKALKMARKTIREVKPELLDRALLELELAIARMKVALSKNPR